MVFGWSVFIPSQITNDDSLVDQYEKDGHNREWVEVIADNFQMLDRSTDVPSDES